MDTLDAIIDLLFQNEKTQKDLTDYLGLDENIFTLWLSGKSDSYITYVPKIAEYLKVSDEYLLGIEQPNAEESLEVNEALDFYEKFKSLPEYQQTAIALLVNQNNDG